MKYYKKIPLDFFDIIVAKSLAYIQKHDDIYYRKKSASFYPLNTTELLTVCPEINLAFANYNIVCNYASAYVTYKTSDNNVHIDDWHHKARINLPILNCKNTYTNFYSNVKTEKITNTSTGLSHYKVINTDYILDDAVEMDSATVIMVSQGHKVVMNTDVAPRITLSLGFDKDPVFIIHNE